MGCCGGGANPSGLPPPGSRQANDILVRPKWRATQRTYGATSGRYYGKVSSFHLIWIDPRDYRADRYEKVETKTPTSDIHTQDTEPNPTVDYASMTKAELTVLAQERGMVVPNRITKTELIDQLAQSDERA